MDNIFYIIFWSKVPICICLANKCYFNDDILTDKIYQNFAPLPISNCLAIFFCVSVGSKIKVMVDYVVFVWRPEQLSLHDEQSRARAELVNIIFHFSFDTN